MRREAGSVSIDFGFGFSSLAVTGGTARASSEVDDGLNSAKKADRPRLVYFLEEHTFFVLNLVLVGDDDIHEDTVISSPLH